MSTESATISERAGRRSAGYRPDVDGLRAVAVLSVFAFHLGVTQAPGGYLGVDVFFVISGYLICGLISHQIDEGRFSLSGFYVRRIRRLFPALGVVLLATTIAAGVILFPWSFKEFGQSLLAATLSSSNFYFGLNSGYFQDQSSVRPLLHTWSLAVEEQFYLVFPMAFVALCKLRRPLMLSVMVGLALLSFALSTFIATKDPTATFYPPYTRAWELLLGALLALGVVRLPRIRGIDQVAGLLGLGMIAWSVLRGDEAAGFPGLPALPACLGAALIIAAGERGRGVATRLLSLRPVVLVGLMSYSLYLWHWPVIVLYREAVGVANLSKVEEAAILAASLALAFMSWKFVEQPARRGPSPPRRVFQYAAAGAGMIAATAIGIVVSNGLPERFSPQIVKMSSYAAFEPRRPFREGACFVTSKAEFATFDPGLCLHTDAAKRNVLLMGDSHAAHFWQALSTTSADVNMMQATVSGCTPTVDLPAWVPPRCRKLLGYIYGQYLPSHHVDQLVLSAEWTLNDLPRLERTITWAQAHHVPLVLIGPSMEYEQRLPLLLARSMQSKDQGIARRNQLPDTGKIDDALARMAAARGVPYASVYREVCPAGQCRDTVDGKTPMLFDRDHFTPAAARWVVTALRRDGALQL